MTSFHTSHTLAREENQEKFIIRMVPTWTEKTGKPGKMGKLFPVREKSGNVEQTGKVREFYPKY